MHRESCAQASPDHGPAGTHAYRREIRLVLHTVLNKVIAKNTTLDWWREQGARAWKKRERDEYGGRGGAEEERAGSGILKVAGSGKNRDAYAT